MPEEILPGVPGVITSLTPKLYIKDAGTNYDTGEETNGLWPNYSNIGHWPLTEKSGFIGFNNRNRGNRDMFLSNIAWGVDSAGSYVRYKLPRNGEQLSEPSPNMYMMMGSGGSFNESGEFDQFLKSGGLAMHTLNYQFDMWISPQILPLTTERQTLLYLHHDDQDRVTNRLLRFSLGRDVGGLYLGLEITTPTHDSFPLVKSYAAGEKLNSMGLHHVGFLLRAENQGYLVFTTSDDKTFSVKSVTPPGYGQDFMLNNPSTQNANTTFAFYVNGETFSIDEGAGNLDLWYRGDWSSNVNPFLGCEISTNKPIFGKIQNSGTQQVRFDHHFSGRIYAAQWNNSIEAPTPGRLKKLYNLKFDVPRGPAWVDFSDQYEYRGKNMLKDLAQITQAIETKSGNFYVTLNQITARNG